MTRIFRVRADVESIRDNMIQSLSIDKTIHILDTNMYLSETDKHIFMTYEVH